jgi:hypothetical protein
MDVVRADDHLPSFLASILKERQCKETAGFNDFAAA